MWVATKRRVEGLVGAVTSLPANQQLGDAWLLPWRTLGPNQSCHLRDLVHPEHAPALPELIEASSMWAITEPQRSARQESTQSWHVPPFTGKRSYELASKADEAAAIAFVYHKSVASSELPAYHVLSLLLSPRQWDILSLCFAHPLLGRDDLSVVLGMRPKSVQLLLTDLSQKGLLTQTATSYGGRWHLTEAGLRLLARSACCPVQRLARLPVSPSVPLQQRGVAGLLHQIQHTAGMYAFLTGLIRDVAATPGARVCWWETGAPCEHVFTYREQTYHFKPDALACVQFGDRTIRFWLEWDRGTMGVRDLEHKCATYAAYLTSRAWTTIGTVLPALVYIAPEIAQERRFVKTATALLAHLPALHIYTTTVSFLAQHSALEPVWQHLHFQSNVRSHSLPEHLPRIALFTGESESTVSPLP